MSSFLTLPRHSIKCLINGYYISYYGVQESTLCWIESFFSQRKQSVLDGTQSTEADVLCRKVLSSDPYFSWPLLMTCQSPQITQMPDCLLTIAFSIDMSRQVIVFPLIFYLGDLVPLKFNFGGHCKFWGSHFFLLKSITMYLS